MCRRSIVDHPVQRCDASATAYDTIITTSQYREQIGARTAENFQIPTPYLATLIPGYVALPSVIRSQGTESNCKSDRNPPLPP